MTTLCILNYMTPQEILDACTDKGVHLRINPDGRLTATPKRKLTDELLQEIKAQRPQIVELIEARDKEVEVLIDELPKEPPKPSIAEQIIEEAKRHGVQIVLDTPSIYGRLKCITEFETVSEVQAQIAGLPVEEPLRQRKQVPDVLRAPINNFRTELLAYLRQPYLPKLEPLPPEATPKQRSIWERMARPDNLMPDTRDNQVKIKKLLYGDQAEDPRLARRQQQLNEALPAVVLARRKG